MGERRIGPRARAVLAGALLGLLGTGCAGGPSTVSFCMAVQATEDLNTFDGQPHVLVLNLYPLSSESGFNEAMADEILKQGHPAGLVGPAPLPSRTIFPGQRLPIQEDLPANASYVGVLADYYQTSGGRRTQVLPAKCGWRGGPTLVLTRNGIEKQ